MHFIKEIFENKISSKLHNKFVRYSRGNFVGPLLNVKISKNKIKFKGSFHYVSEFLENLEKSLKEEELHIKGVIRKDENLTEKFESIDKTFIKSTKSNSLWIFKVDFYISLKELVDVFKNCDLFLNFKSNTVSLKTKTTFPKPNKEFGADFVVVEILNQELRNKFLEDYLFDIKDLNKVKEINIKHSIIIEDIILPKNTRSFEVARKLALRKGKIIRGIGINKGSFNEKKINFKI
jgi:hypothetical protein